MVCNLCIMRAVCRYPKPNAVVVGGDGSVNTGLGDEEPLVMVGSQDHHHPLPVIPALYTKLLLLVCLLYVFDAYCILVSLNFYACHPFILYIVCVFF